MTDRQQAPGHTASTSVSWTEKGLSALTRRDLHQAGLCFKQALDADQDNLSAWKGLGTVLASAKLFKDAIFAFDQCLTRNPHDLDALRSSAAVHIQAEQYRRAAEMLETSLKIQPDQPKLHRSLELLQLHLEKTRRPGLEPKLFRQECEMFLRKLRDNVPFALTRFGDGELSIIEGRSLDLTEKGNGEFVYRADGTMEEHRRRLRRSFQYKADGYYIGIACPCCVGQEKFEYMRDLSGVGEEHLTWANILVNANYKRFCRQSLEIFQDRRVLYVCHRKSNVAKLPFDVEKVFGVGTNAWIEDAHVVDEVRDYIDSNNLEGAVVLASAGPLANFLCCELFAHNPKNTYLDIGSIYDSIMDLGQTRGYLAGSWALGRVCRWG